MLRERRAVTLLEIMVVVVLIGILATLALPNFRTHQERALDNEVKANLKLIQEAEKIYRMDHGKFYTEDGSSKETADINQNLKLNLSATNWKYTVCSNAGESPLNVRAYRVNPPTGWDRYFFIDEVRDKRCCCPNVDAVCEHPCHSGDCCGFHCPCS